MTTLRHNEYNIVDGVLSLPDGLTVGGSLYLGGCTALTALPDGLTVGGSLHLVGCTALTALPDGLTVRDGLYLEGCTALTSLPDGMTIGCWLSCDHFTYYFGGGLDVHVSLPETVVAGMPGMRIEQIIDHPWIRYLGLDKMIVSYSEIDDDGIYLTLEPALECAA